MSQIERSLSSDLQAENTQLRQELQIRDQLVDQLAQELFELIKEHPEWVSLTPATSTPALTPELQLSQQQLQDVELQIRFYQEQIANRDAAIAQLHQVNQSLSASQQELAQRNQKLEQLVQELPEVYRQKFSQRLSQVKEKLAALERENSQLKTELQETTDYLALATSATPSDMAQLPPPVNEHQSTP